MMMGFIYREKARKHFSSKLFSFRFELIRSAQRFEIGVLTVDINIHYGGV